ncbi:MAG: transposase [Alphaproteobacteria bacterium]
MNSRYYPIDESYFVKEIQPHIALSYKRVGRPAQISHYQFFCAVLYVLRTGVSWRDVPAHYGSWHTIYTRFNRWSANGLFWSLLYHLQQSKKITVDISWVDSTTIAIHRHGSGVQKKRGHKLLDADEKV